MLLHIGETCDIDKELDLKFEFQDKMHMIIEIQKRCELIAQVMKNMVYINCKANKLVLIVHWQQQLTLEDYVIEVWILKFLQFKFTI